MFCVSSGPTTSSAVTTQKERSRDSRRSRQWHSANSTYRRVVLHNPNESSLSLSSTGGSIRRRRDNKKIKTWKRVRVQVNQFCDTEEEWKTKILILCYMRFSIYYHMQWLDNSSYNQAMTKEVTCSQLCSTCGVLKGPVRWYWAWVSESRHLESINNSQAP